MGAVVTVGELRSTVQDLIGPHNGMRPLSATMIDELVQKAQTHIFHEITNWRSRADTSINVVASTATYDLPTDYLSMISVTLSDGSTFSQIRPLPFDLQHDEDYYTVTSPRYIVDASSTAGRAAITLLPTPTTSVTSGLAVRYKRRPTRLSSYAAVTTEVTDIDPNLHLPVAYEAAWLYLSRQGSKSIKDFAGYHQYFLEEVANEKRRSQEEWQQDFIPTIVPTFGGLE